ncbi:lipase [Nocardioides agariphilus]|uniref:Lipase n=1 Tax=Nocardioides agariphilus TaxID=433664 RepID=A0A930YKW9_9ACTN|nr:lipase [Nocardioides agariphilus]
MLDALAPARRRFLLGVLALALVAVAGLGVAIWRTHDKAVEPVSQETQGPVLLVPGYGGGTAGLEVLAGALRAQGRDVEIVDLPGNNTGDLDRQAGALGKAVILALQRAGARSVDVVGYSAGGVVARLWVRDHGGGGLARRVVTLGSPHHGSDLAGLGSDVAPDSCPRACEQLQPDSDLLRALNAGDETPTGPKWVSIWTTDDRVVVPPSSSNLDGALDFTIQSVCPGHEVSHGQLPQDPVVIAAVIRQLVVADPAVPGPEIC